MLCCSVGICGALVGECGACVGECVACVRVVSRFVLASTIFSVVSSVGLGWVCVCVCVVSTKRVVLI